MQMTIEERALLPAAAVVVGVVVAAALSTHTHPGMRPKDDINIILCDGKGSAEYFGVGLSLCQGLASTHWVPRPFVVLLEVVA